MSCKQSLSLLHVNRIRRWSCVLTCSYFPSHDTCPDMAQQSLAAPLTVWDLWDSHTSLVSVHSFKTFHAFFSVLLKAHLQLLCPISHLGCIASCHSAQSVTQQCPCAGDEQVPSCQNTDSGCSSTFSCWRKGKAWPFSASPAPAGRVNTAVQPQMSCQSPCPACGSPTSLHLGLKIGAEPRWLEVRNQPTAH